MAATFTATSLFSQATMLRASSSSSPVLGLPLMKRVGKVKCSMEVKPNTTHEKKDNPSTCAGASLMAVATTATMWNPGAALALVDERMSTEGTGLPFGLSDGLLGWILLAGFALIWSFYFIYASGLDEDEDSGLSL